MTEFLSSTIHHRDTQKFLKELGIEQTKNTLSIIKDSFSARIAVDHGMKYGFLISFIYLLTVGTDKQISLIPWAASVIGLDLALRLPSVFFLQRQERIYAQQVEELDTFNQLTKNLPHKNSEHDAS